MVTDNSDEQDQNSSNTKTDSPKEETPTPADRELLTDVIEEIDVRDIALPDAVLPHTLFVVPLQFSPVYPGMMAPLFLSNPKLIETLEAATANRGILGLILTTDESVPSKTPTANILNPLSIDNTAPPPSNGELSPQSILNLKASVDGLKGMYAVGTAVRVLKKLNTSDGGVTVLVQSLKRFIVKKVVREEPYVVAQVEYKEDLMEKSMELDALTRSVISQVKKLSEHNPFFTEEIKLAMVNTSGAAALADFVAFALSLKRKEAQDFLETFDVKQRFEKLLFYLKREQEVADIQKRIQEDVNQKIQKMQREYFLREQMRSIRKELGGENDPGKALDKYREKIKTLKLSDEAKKIAEEELAKLEATSESSPEFNILRNYLDWMLALPWRIFSKDLIDLKKARTVLNEDHYGIPKVKERILEFLAVKKLNPQAKGSILCFVGPPGVGKTSLGKSIASAMGRNFFRFSLGGMRDEAEIKGHRRTYIGAMPGKLLNAMKRAGTQNPVIILDEVDKLGASFHGDPASALLEVLDPEQNNAFLDHYLDVPFDLSNVLFILTANTLSSVPAPLLDRMEIVELNGYTLEEKQEIAKTHIIPKELEKHGVTSQQVEFSEKALRKLMLEYCREPGVRTLQQKIAAILRRVVLEIVENPKKSKIFIEPEDLYSYLGPEKFENELTHRVEKPGVVTGLAWTALGGQVLFVEASDVPRKLSVSKVSKIEQRPDLSFGNLKLTGQLGEVMSESAAIAYSYVKKKTKKSKVAQDFFDQNDIHLHIPAGAIPKDGPSAGVTMATALMSLVTGRKVREKVAMTGELSLVGNVLPVGGIKEKVLAAKRAGVERVIMPLRNKKDLLEIPKTNLKGIKFTFAENVEDVFKAALTKN